MKCKLFKERSQNIEEQDALMAKFRSCSNMNEAMELIPQLEKLECRSKHHRPSRIR